jgi:hypothetical protein
MSDFIPSSTDRRDDTAIALRAALARVAELEAEANDFGARLGSALLERDRLKAALEAAPEPNMVAGDAIYGDWHFTTRAEALR